jgi:hypothetical protein
MFNKNELRRVEPIINPQKGNSRLHNAGTCTLVIVLTLKVQDYSKSICKGNCSRKKMDMVYYSEQQSLVLRIPVTAK